MPLDTQFIIEQYKQTNDHLRETDRKRDVMLGFYVTATAALYGLAGKLAPGDINLFFGALGLAFAGVCLSFLFTAYRYIHGAYMLQIAMMSYFLHFTEGYLPEDVTKVPFRFSRDTFVEIWPFTMLHVLVTLNALGSVYFAPDIPMAWRYLAVIAVVADAIAICAHMLLFWLLDSKDLVSEPKKRIILKPESMWVLHTLWGAYGLAPKRDSSASQQSTSER